MFLLQEEGNTLNAISGSECGYFLPAQPLPQGTARERTLTATDTNLTDVFISVTRADDGEFVGYVSKGNKYNNPFYGVTSNVADAVLVSIPTGSGVSITRSNAPDSSHPYLGFVVGPESISNDLEAGSFNDALLLATSFSPPNSTASHQVSNTFITYAAGESSVWSSPAGSDVLTPEWTNEDSSTASTTLLYLPDSDAFAITGDVYEYSHHEYTDTSNPTAVIFTALVPGLQYLQ